MAATDRKEPMMPVGGQGETPIALKVRRNARHP